MSFDELESDLDTYVDAVFGCLESDFLVMPKGEGFVEFPVFESGYEALKRATGSFRTVTLDTVAPVVFETPLALIVFRCMLGFNAAGVGLLRQPAHRRRDPARRSPNHRSQDPCESRGAVVARGEDRSARSCLDCRCMSCPGIRGVQSIARYRPQA